MQSFKPRAQDTTSVTSSLDLAADTLSTALSFMTASHALPERCEGVSLQAAASVSPASRTVFPPPATAVVPASTSATVLSDVASQHVKAALRHGSPRTRGPHSISPMAPDAMRAPPAELRGPPRYLRARGITPASREAPARSGREPRRQQQQRERDARCRCSPSQEQEQDSGHRSNHDTDGNGSHHGSRDDSNQCMTHTTSPTQLQLHDDANDGSESPVTRKVAAPLHLVASSQESGLSCSPLSTDQHRHPSDHYISHRPQQAGPANAPPPRSTSPCSRRGGAAEDVVLTVPRLSSTQTAISSRHHPRDLCQHAVVAPLASSTQRQRLWGTGCNAFPGAPLRPVMPHLSPHVDVPEDFSLSGKGAKASDAASSEVAPPVARPASTFTASPPLKNTSLIQRSCVAQSVWSGLLDDSMRPLGAHRRVGPAMPSASQPLSSPRAASTSAAITGATSVPVVTIEVAVVASAASSPPGLALLELYENVWKRWCSRNGRDGSKGVARRDSQSTQPTRQTWHTDEDLATVFDLVERIPLTTVDTVTVGDIKCEVEWRTGLPAAQQCLAYDAISLHDCLPVHLLLSTADQYSNKSSDGSVGAERDAAIGEEAGDVCLRFVCVPLSSDSSALMMAAAPWNDRVGLSPRASSQSTAGDDCANTPARGRASMSAMSHDANKSDRGGVITSPSRNSMSSIPPDTRAPVTAAAAAAAAAPRDPQRRPGAVPFMSSYGTTTTAPAATSHIEQAVSMHISRMRRVYFNHAGTSDQSIREGEGEA